MFLFYNKRKRRNRMIEEVEAKFYEAYHSSPKTFVENMTKFINTYLDSANVHVQALRRFVHLCRDSDNTPGMIYGMISSAFHKAISSDGIKKGDPNE